MGKINTVAYRPAFGSSDRTRSCPMGNPDGFAHTVRSPAR